MEKSLLWKILKDSKKIYILFLFCIIQSLDLIGQDQLYDNFEGAKVIYYGERWGVLDTNANNPAPNNVNSSSKCGLYVRNGAKKFANIKMNLARKLKGVDEYATYLGTPKKIKMKVYTAAPAGTLIEILLGTKKGNNDYPAGTHSQYQAYTTASNTWEELEFKFSQIPQGSETSASQIDQIVLLFNPNSTNSDTYYFDDITGPPLSEKSENPKKETAAGQEKMNKEKTEKTNKEKGMKQPGTKKTGASKEDGSK